MTRKKEPTELAGDGTFVLPALSKEAYRDMARHQAADMDRPLKDVFADMADQFDRQGETELAAWARLDKHFL